MRRGYRVKIHLKVGRIPGQRAEPTSRRIRKPVRATAPSGNLHMACLKKMNTAA